MLQYCYNSLLDLALTCRNLVTYTVNSGSGILAAASALGTICLHHIFVRIAADHHQLAKERCSHHLLSLDLFSVDSPSLSSLVSLVVLIVAR